ncbi:MAG: hypothetical protein IKT27_03455, partial [Clostridia bacterium]|nr:hypothetical protein [Clostridia bacterium]
DRQDIVSNPVETDNGYKSLVGGDIFVNLLDGYAESDGAVRFESIYSAKNNETYVMQTNKLPVVVYVPISKYGATIYDGNNYLFNANQTLGKFFNISQDAQDMEIYYLERYNTAEGNTKSRLMLSYFGENNILTSGFENTSSYLNPSFDLTIKITDNKGKTTSSALNQSFASNYWVSNNITEAGIYTVEIIQNATYGSVYPNIYKTFKFTFEIIEKPPVFDFVDVATGDKFASDNNGVYYSNKSSVRVEWADPTSIYLAEIDKGNIYYTINGIRKNIAISDIQTTDNKNFSFTINNLKNKDIVVVHMQYLGAQSANSYLNQELIIDTEAPTTVLNTLISATGLKDNNNFTSQIRNVDATYNITGFTGYLAYYYFTVGHNVAYLNNLLSQKASVNGYFTDGNKYYIKLISDINSYEISSVAEALNKVNAINTDYNVIPGAMMSGRYYEILELDLAGNLSLYTIKVVATNPYDIVVSYDKEETDYNSDFELTYQELSNNSNIFAKGKFVATSLDLYENDWLFFTVNDTTYFKSPNLDENEFYNFSKWTNLSLQPQIATLEDIMSFENAGKNVLTITDTAFPNGTNAKVCTVNIYVTKTELTSSLLSVDEGIRITGNNYQYPVSMKIYSYINNRYQLIYDKTTFTSTQEITFSSGSTSYTFTVVNPENAYKYEFVDNFGISYVDYHTVGVEKLPEDQIVQNHITTHEITSDGDTNTWYIGFDDLTYNYNASEYNAFIRVYYLAFNQTLQKVEWKEYIYPDGNIDPVLGCELVSGVSTPYFKVTNTKTINHIEVFAQDSISKFSGYSGNAIKAVITLKNQKDSSSSDVIVDHLLINNITPEVRLTDNNGQDKSALLDGNSLYSGQITILYDLKNFDNEFVFPYSFGLIYNNNEEEPLESGERIADAGTYIINIYTTIDSQRYLIKSHSILIEPSEDFYNVVVFDDTANMYIDVLPTGEVFEDENTGIVCYKHFIVRTEQYKINVSENDEILDPMNPANASTCIVSKISSANNTYYTIIYLITNSQSTSLDIRPCHFHIAITYIPPSTVLFESVFGYDIDSDGQLLTLAGASDKISISEMDQNFVELTISYNSYYLVEENKITPTMYFGDNLDMLYEPTITEVNGVSTFSLKFNGLYLLSFKDIAGNVHLFTDSITGNRVNAYRLIYVNGVAFDINGKTPIENAIYDNEVLITLPDYLNEVYSYDVGGSPKIAVTKNGKAIEVAYNSEKGGYVISGAGYYSVYFDAMIDGKATRKVVYNFNIIATDEFKTDFNFAQYGEYEIIKVKKDGRVVDYSGLFPHDVDTKHLKSINLSINDEMTGEGKYQITVATNSGLKNILQGGNEEETFTFNLIIKHIGYVPIEVSINEGESTTDKIKISFNASDVFNSVGECVIICGNTIYEINEAYVNSLKADGSSFQTCEIAETGTHFVQVYSSSGKLLYSYKVIKTEPLNAVSIILIVVSVLAVAGLVITVTLLRNSMKIR